MNIGVLVAVSPKPTFAFWAIGLTHHSTGPVRKAAQAGEFKRSASIPVVNCVFIQNETKLVKDRMITSV